MHFLNLSNELLCLIASSLNYECDINSLSQANARLYLLLNPTLYQHNVRYSHSSALGWAAKYGHEATARKAQEAGASPDCDDNEWRPINLAAANGHDALVRLFLAQGVNPNRNLDESQNSNPPNPLALATSNGYESIVKVLLAHGAAADIPVLALERTPLSVAAEEGHLGIVKLLAQAKCDIQSRDPIGLTPLTYAVCKGRVDVVQFLLDQGAEPNTYDGYGIPILFKATQFESIFELLLDRGADPNTKAMYTVDIFNETLRSGNPELVRILLARRNILNWTEQDYVLTDVLHGGEAMLKFAMTQGMNLDAKEARLAMYEAASYGDAGLVKFFLDQGVQLEPVPNDSLALKMATYRKTPKVTAEIAGILLDHGANVDSLFRFSWGSLVKSIDQNESAIQLLLERGAYPFTPSFDSPDSNLADAARKGSENVVKYLLDAIDRRNIPVDDIRSELFYAVSKAADHGHRLIGCLIELYYWKRKHMEAKSRLTDYRSSPLSC